MENFAQKANLSKIQKTVHWVRKNIFNRFSCITNEDIKENGIEGLETFHIAEKEFAEANANTVSQILQKVQFLVKHCLYFPPKRMLTLAFELKG